MTWEDVRDEIEALLKDKTPDQVIAYVNANITDLASAKEHLRKLTLVVMFMLNNTNYDFRAEP